MDIEFTPKLHGVKREKWVDFLQKAGLAPGEQVQTTVLIWENDELIATGSRQDNVLKYIAVDPGHRGQDLTATVLTSLRQDAFHAGHSHLFLYTKPANELMFSSLFFYPIAKTEQVLLMENKQNGITSFLDTFAPATHSGTVGALVMNCNPFTKGHRYLIETAAKECGHVYVFVLSEDKSDFSAKDRMEMVKLGTQDLNNVTVLPTGPYLISSATFPAYFLKDRENATNIQCLLDIEVFAKYYAPKFGIARRYVGTEPLSPLTQQYNQALGTYLPARGIELREIPRLESQGAPVSATSVRNSLHDPVTLKTLVPDTTYTYLEENGLLK